MSDWTLITVAYNSAHTLRDHWAPGPPADVEWIVVDNDSQDDTVDVAQQLGARVIRVGENVGFARANNIGLRHANGRFVGFINPDVRVKYEDLPDLGRHLDQDPAILAPQLLNPDSSRQPNGRGAPILATKMRNRLLRSRGLEGSYLLPVKDGTIRSVWWATGAALLATKNIINRLGGWDERYFLYHEDSDICMRAWRAGIAVKVVGTHMWEHSWARESASLKLRPILHELRSSLIFYRSYPQLIFGGPLPRSTFRRTHRAVTADWESAS